MRRCAGAPIEFSLSLAPACTGGITTSGHLAWWLTRSPDASQRRYDVPCYLYLPDPG